MANRRKIPESGESNAGFSLDSGTDSTVPTIESIDPSELSNSSTSGETGTGVSDTGSGTGKRRGRPKGSKNKSSGQGKTNDKTDLTKLLVSLHSIGSTLLKMEELEIDKEEAEQLSDAINDVNALYNYELSQTVVAWSNLAMACTAIYGPRLLAINNNRKKNAPIIIRGNTIPNQPNSQPN